MTATATVNEFAKMRRLRIAPVAAVLVLCVAGLSVLGAVSSPSFTASSEQSWELLLAGLALAVPLVSPILLAVLASRQVDVEHHGNGWILSATSGVAPGRLCRAKFFALGAFVAAATLAQSTAVAGVGLMVGIAAPFPVDRWLGYTVAVLVINLVLLAFHLLLSARVDNQLVGLGIGVLGCVVAGFSSGLPSGLAHVTPWGYYALSAAADYRDGELLALTPSYVSVAALGVLGAALFLFATALFDRRES